MSAQKVIVIDSDAMLLEMYERQLQERYEVLRARRAQDALDLLDQHGASVIVTDIMIGSNNGVEIIHELRSYDDWADIPIIVLSSLPERSFKPIEWSRYGVSRFMYKATTSPKQLLYAVNDAVSAYAT